MTIRIRVQMTLLAAALMAATGWTGAQQPPVTSAVLTAALTQTVPVDTQITQGTLPNGLRYYVRANRKPEKRAELRLAVNVGSLMEEDDQQGLAHFVEHMAFNGTKNFPKSDIVKFMESIGMQFGPSVNAFTSFDETVYMLQIPTDKPDVIDRSLLVLDPYRALDVRLTKSLSIGRGRRLELLIEGFNVTNHVNFRPPVGNPPGAGAPMNAPAFLVRTIARDARQIQWGLRYVF